MMQESCACPTCLDKQPEKHYWLLLHVDFDWDPDPFPKSIWLSIETPTPQRKPPHPTYPNPSHLQPSKASSISLTVHGVLKTFGEGVQQICDLIIGISHS